MGAAAILLVTGICVFLIWFFEKIVKDAETDDSEPVYIYLHREDAAHRRLHCPAAPGVDFADQKITPVRRAS